MNDWKIQIYYSSFLFRYNYHTQKIKNVHTIYSVRGNESSRIWMIFHGSIIVDRYRTVHACAQPRHSNTVIFNQKKKIQNEQTNKNINRLYGNEFEYWWGCWCSSSRSKRFSFPFFFDCESSWEQNNAHWSGLFAT